MELPEMAVVVPFGWRRLLCHVLIIEDEAMIALDLEWLLEGEGASSFAFAASMMRSTPRDCIDPTSSPRM